MSHHQPPHTPHRLPYPRLRSLGPGIQGGAPAACSVSVSRPLAIAKAAIVILTNKSTAMAGGVRCPSPAPLCRHRSPLYLRVRPPGGVCASELLLVGRV